MSHSSLDTAATQLRTADLTEQERCELLADERRRVAISVLDERTTSLQLRELAADVAGRETTGDRVTEDVVERVSVALHHVHLPKLSELGVISYEPESRRVRP